MKPVVLCIMDGWGEGVASDNNAVTRAETPVFDRLRRLWPAGLMQASGSDVGLPDGQIGNSEVGHMNLGAGRIVLQDLPRINRAVADGSLAASPELRVMIDALHRSRGACHLLGLLSRGGVHSHRDHIAALASALARAGIPVLVHAVLDGRDVPPKSALDDITWLESRLAPSCRIATVAGRFYTMDRDRRWARTETAWRAMVRGEGNQSHDAGTAITAGYQRGETDEFITPTLVGAYRGINDGDGLLVANFRSDRARQVLDSLVDPAFDGFQRAQCPEFADCLGMVPYSADLDRRFRTLFPQIRPEDTIGETVAQAGLRQLRIAETEKYPHVTFFLNGGSEAVFEGEERIFVASPKVRTYDLQPEMSAGAVTEHIVNAIRSGRFDLIVANFANPDMVGHTGDLAAAVNAVETVDRCVGNVVAALEQTGGVMLLTADHGNCEVMIDPDTGAPHTAHTTNPVPVILVGAPGDVIGLQDGRLADVAPTLLELLGLEIPPAMTGRSLLRTAAASRP